MPFAPGQPRPAGAGRKKGSSIRASVQATLARLKCDPIEGMVLIAQDKMQSAQLRGRMFAELAQYVYPKRRAIEMSGLDGSNIELDLNVSYREQLLSRIAQLATRK